MINNTLGINLFQNFATILVWKFDRVVDKYIKSKNQEIIILIIKIKGCNSQWSYK